MNYIQRIFEKTMVEALGWTLVHSIWQISIVAIIVALLLVLLHRKKAALRYGVVVTAFISILFLAFITFQKYYVQPVNAVTNNDIVSSERLNGGSHQVESNNEIVLTQPVYARTLNEFGQYFGKNLPVIVSFWFLCVVVLLIRYLGGLAWMLRVKYMAKPVDVKYQQLVIHLSIKMKINRIVRVLEIIRVNSPGVVGHFKPVILLPVSFFSGLSEREVEVILLHELAHIKRNDFLVNIIHSFLEILFFFHPAIWWLSGVLKSEREHACDDLAVENGADKYILARTLTFISEHSLQRDVALAFSGKKNKIKYRIQRLILTNNMKTNFKTKLMSAITLIALIATMSFSLKDGNVAEDEPQRNVPVAEKEAEDVAESKEFISSESTDATLQPKDDKTSTDQNVQREDEEGGEAFFKSLMKQGSKKWNMYRKQHPDIDFESVLKESNLSDFNLRKFNLAGVNLKEATLNGTDFTEANLARVNLKEANLLGAKFINANLQGANLKETILSDCNFSGADLRGANLKEVKFRNADFTKADLRGVDLHQAIIQGGNFKGAIVDHTTLLPPNFDLKKEGVTVK